MHFLAAVAAFLLATASASSSSVTTADGADYDLDYSQMETHNITARDGTINTVVSKRSPAVGEMA